MPAIPSSARCVALLLYCRGGFEAECAKEIAAASRASGIAGSARGKSGAAMVEFVLDEPDAVATLSRTIRFDPLVFARQLIFVTARQVALPGVERLQALLPAIDSIGASFSALWLETADTNEAKELATFCRKFRVPLASALEQAERLDETRAALPRLHLFFTDSTNASVGVSVPDNSSPWPMGIPRLRFPSRAPSRSTQKLAEALQLWLPAGAEAALLHEGVTAVDLGAAPGGWTWQLVRRNVHVTAVDNGALDPALLATGLVEHVRADGFRFRPRWPVGWMVCDIVEQPKRVAALVGDWLANRWCTHCIFNLKLPMRERFDELARCRAAILDRCEGGGVRCTLRFKHLYHDREEVTGYAVAGGRADRGRKNPARRGDEHAS